MNKRAVTNRTPLPETDRSPLVGVEITVSLGIDLLVKETTIRVITNDFIRFPGFWYVGNGYHILNDLRLIPGYVR